jgi:protein-disulfide isomerase
MPAAIAAECIHQEFGLASMYRYMRVLMETSDLSDNSLQTVAEQAGVWNNSVSACISEKTTETIIQDHIQEGKMFTVSGTPSSVILDLHSGKRIKIT